MNDPHENEYHAAVQGMHDTYGWRECRPEPAVGDFVSGVSAGKHWSGHVDHWAADDRVVVNVGGAWVAVHPRDITH